MKNRLTRLIALLIVLSTLGSFVVSCSPAKDNGREPEAETEEKSPTGVDEDGMKYTTVSLTDSGLALAPSFDVNGNIASLTYTRKEYATVAQTFADAGFNRVYVVTTRTGVPAASSAANQWNDPGDTRYTISNSLIMSGDANFEFLYACHKAGLEAIAVYKPYESGGVSKGADADLSSELYYEETVGGYWTGYDAFTSNNPEMRLARKENSAEDAIKNDVITKIDAAFIIDAYTFTTWTGSKRTGAAISNASVNRTPIKLYVSKNNLDYVEYSGNYNVDFTIEQRTYLDENGWPMFDKKVRCLVATVSGIEIGAEYQYMALTMEDNSGRVIIPQSMINLYNAKGEKLPSTAGIGVRYLNSATPVRPEGYIWGAENTIQGTNAESLQYFESWGFEFDYMGTYVNNDQAYVNSYVYGIARGNFKYAKGTLCEAYPEVQAYWLSEVENLLTMGYDGIEVRLQSHSSMIADYASYGFNEPLMQAYINQYGEDPRAFDTVTKETAYRIACLRGDYFMQFMTAAAEMTHAKGKIFGFHMRSGMLDTSMDVIMNAALHQCFNWTMPKIVFDWKQAADLCETITIKQNFSNKYNSELIKELTDYAVSRGTQVWITAYTQQITYLDEDGVQVGEANVDNINKIAEDDNVYGVQLYEWDPRGNKFTHIIEKLKEQLNYIPREVE